MHRKINKYSDKDVGRIHLDKSIKRLLKMNISFQKIDSNFFKLVHGNKKKSKTTAKLYFCLLPCLLDLNCALQTHNKRAEMEKQEENLKATV